jgi:hypothetical protein
LPFIPSLTSGLRPFQTPTGQTHRPGSGSMRAGGVVERGGDGVLGAGGGVLDAGDWSGALVAPRRVQ